MYKYKGDNPSELLDKNNYPLSFGEGELEVVFDKISDADIKWAKEKLSGNQPIKKLNEEILRLCEIGSVWRLLILSESKGTKFGLKKESRTTKVDLNFKKGHPIRRSSFFRKIECVKVLLSQKADPNQDEGFALTICARDNSLEILKLLVDNGGDISCNNYKPLIAAKQKNNYAITRYLEGLMNGNTLTIKEISTRPDPPPAPPKPNSAKPETALDKDTDPKWSKINDYTIAYDGICDNKKIGALSVFNFAARKINTTIYKLNTDGSKFICSQDLQDFKDVESNLEIEIAKAELIKQGGSIPVALTDKSNKTTGLIDVTKRPVKQLKTS